ERQALILIEDVFGKNSIDHLGQVPAEEVSAWMQTADLGLSKADYAMYGKSASTIAMLEHGLPVLLRGKTSEKRNRDNTNVFDDQLILIDSRISALPQKKKPKELLSIVAKLFLTNLNV